MELRASADSAAGLKSCLIAARYAGVKVKVAAVDDSSPGLKLVTPKGEIRGRSAVLRCECSTAD